MLVNNLFHRKKDIFVYCESIAFFIIYTFLFKICKEKSKMIWKF